ncbi:SGS domain-containing protein [Sarocladium implicatum]|nr:SGS domain-containing protein [Sarocladium implicatum]
MSHITLAQQGIAAVDKRQWDEAITKLSTALQTSQNPYWLIARSKALLGAKRFEAALEDADLAWHNAYQRNKRDALAEAQYRRAVAYFRLKQYANADACCLYSMRIIKGSPAVEKQDPADEFVQNGVWTQTLDDAKEQSQIEEAQGRAEDGLAAAMGQGASKVSKEWRMASVMRVQVLTAMEKLPADDPARKKFVSLKPPHKELSSLASGSAEDVKKEHPYATSATASTTTAPVTAAAKPADAPMRLQDFQNDTTMSVSIFSKGNRKENLKVDILPKSITLDPIIHPNGEAKVFHIDLWGEIDTEGSKYTVTPSKVELSLKKAVPGKWAQLRGDDLGASQGAPSQAPAKPAAQPATESQPKANTAPDRSTTKPPGPSYPTSSRSGPKNWDSIGDESDHEGEDGVNTFFKKIYKDATPEQQRAMMKSFTESNGTSLSTDWNDVKDRKVQTVPPEGVEAKKWD